MAHYSSSLQKSPSEERDLSQLLYQKLLGLNKIHEPNKDLRKLLSEEMFLKVNQLAFYQIMAYLFQIYDTAEFKRRFFWPLLDKKSESDFRTSTRDYLKHLNEKYHLNWTDAISYLVMKPGGIKFILFLLKLVDFVIDHLVKQKEKQIMSRKLLGSNARSPTLIKPITKKHLNYHLKKNIFLKEFSSAYLKTMHDINETIEEKIQILKKEFSNLSEATGFDRQYLLSQQFLNDLKAHVVGLYQERITHEHQFIQNLNAPVQRLLDEAHGFHGKRKSYENNLKTNYEMLKSLKNIFPQLQVPEEEGKRNSSGKEKNLLSPLIDAYNCVQPTMQNCLDYYNTCKDLNKDGFVDEMAKIANKLAMMENALTRFEKNFMQQIELNEGDVVSILGKPSLSSSHLEMATTPALSRWNEAFSDLLTKLIKTPPIKLNLVSEQQPKVPLIVHSNQDDEFKIPELQIPRNRALTQLNRMTSSKDSSIKNDIISSDVSINQNKSRLFKNPFDLLPSSCSYQYNKSTTIEPEAKVDEVRAQNIENLDKTGTLIIEKMGKLYGKELYPLPLKESNNFSLTELRHIECEGVLTSKNQQKCYKDGILILSTSPPYTPMLSKEAAGIEKTSGNLNRSLLERNVHGVKNFSIIKKVKNISQDVMNMSLSPSGRLDYFKPENSQDSMDDERPTSSVKIKTNITEPISYENQKDSKDDCLKKTDTRRRYPLATSIPALERTDFFQENNKISNSIEAKVFEISADANQDNLFDVTDGVLDDMQF